MSSSSYLKKNGKELSGGNKKMANKSILKDSDVRWDERERRPRRVRGEFTLPFGDTTDGPVKGFLFENADELNLNISYENLQLVDDTPTPARRVVRFQQLHDGIPVFGAFVMVQLDRDNRVRQVDLWNESRLQIVSPVTDSKMTGEQAMKAAEKFLDEFTRRQETGEPMEIYYPTPDRLRLAYKVLILTQKPVHDWCIILDAYTGEILEKDDLVVDLPDGQGFVFDPNPVVTANDNAYREPYATTDSCGYQGTPRSFIDEERVTRTLKEITFSGGKYKLEGPYVKMRNFGSPDIAPPEEADANVFCYSSADDSFKDVMVYYHVDTIQRYIQSLGIATAHNSQIEADAHDGSGGAWYSGIDKGIHFGASGGYGPCGNLPEKCRPDRAQDADVILHEYGHAIQHDQVPGWGQRNPITLRYETRAMGEGFGDILACVFFAPDHPFQREVFEDWIFANCRGLRRVDGTKTYPDDWAHQVHEDGEIWSAALWNIYRAIGGDSPELAVRQAARDELLKTLILSHHAVAANATMPDGAEAIMETNAGLDEYQGRHLTDMLDSFHARGILKCVAGSALKITRFWLQQDDSEIRNWEPLAPGQDNWFYAEVINSGMTEARALVMSFSFKSLLADPVYPSDFRDNIISAKAEFNLVPGATRIVKARWPKDLIIQTQGYILAEIYNPDDHVPEAVTDIGASNGKLKQRNMDMPNTNFHLAPPIKEVDGLTAVPIDIQQLDAQVEFDMQTGKAKVKASMRFIMGGTDGNPVFDLRQKIQKACLNDVEISPDKFQHHNFGGDSKYDDKLGILDTIVAANSENTLRLEYELNEPKSDGLQPPDNPDPAYLYWNFGSTRLYWDFYFTDLYPARYLEMWFPSNLVYDQFKFNLDIEIINSGIEHIIITNGDVTEYRQNHWHIEFPERFTSLSPMLIINPADKIDSYQIPITLPDARQLHLHISKLSNSSVDLETVGKHLTEFIWENVSNVGPYMHGGRFTCFIWTGDRSMEYEGGVTSNLYALKHEVFHCWFARGIKPATQNDSWIDEAWTVYNTDNLRFYYKLFDKCDPPTTLSHSNPFNRVTPGESYRTGSRFFATLAQKLGPTNLRSYMSSFYIENQGCLVTTKQLEEYLITKSGEQDITDDFNQFVYEQES